MLAPWLRTVDPIRFTPAARLNPPSERFWFGTDGFGRDVYSRTLYGGRISLIVGLSVATMSTALGLTIGLVGSGGGPAYTASKHGVVGLVRQLAIVYAERGLTVNAVCPGAVATALRAHSTRVLGANAPPMRGVGGSDEAVKAVTPMGRRGTVEEVAAAVRYLASEEAAYVTGQALAIDGGWTVR